MVQTKGRSKIAAGAVSFVVQHELWDGNVQDHSDQGVVILVEGQVGGKDTTLLRFNCFDIEKSYVYAPDGESKPFRMDPVVDGNPIGWSIQQIRTMLPQMLGWSGQRQQAARLHKKALAARQRTLGPDHPSTRASRRNLAASLRAGRETQGDPPLTKG